ncbi:MAG TPA: response regulator [Gammaproteobacteria bacterium]|nr:response regulator [Gammaproteobacteria bacterium]
MTLHFLIIDDDQTSIEVEKNLLERAGYTVTALTSSIDAVQKILEVHPDVILCDLMMPNLDGLALFKKLRAIGGVKQPVFIIITSKHFETDKHQALQEGVDGFYTKPINPKTFLNEIQQMLADKMCIQFWGVRGTLPVAGNKTARYGGNTNCVTLQLGKKQFFIFDAGTGIKELSNYLIQKDDFPLKAKIFISHPHYDHINGFPFFAPLFIKGNEFEIFGTNQGNKTIEELISGLMDHVYLPFTINEFSAKLTFRNLNEETLQFDNVIIDTLLLNHPGRCLGFRVKYHDKVFCYITDNELCLKDSPYYNQYQEERLIAFIHKADFLVMDSTYTDVEYARKIGWGHSSVSRVVDVAHLAQVKLLCLYHHDPDQFDQQIDAKLQQAIQQLKEKNSVTRCIASHEGQKFLL